MNINKTLLSMGTVFLAGAIFFCSCCEKKDPKLEQIIQCMEVRNPLIQSVADADRLGYITELHPNYDADFSHLERLWDKPVYEYDGDFKKAAEDLFFAVTGRKIPDFITITLLERQKFNDAYSKGSGIIPDVDRRGFVCDNDPKSSYTVYDKIGKPLNMMPIRAPSIYVLAGLSSKVALFILEHELGHVSSLTLMRLSNEISAICFEMVCIDLVIKTCPDLYGRFYDSPSKSAAVRREDLFRSLLKVELYDPAPSNFTRSALAANIAYGLEREMGSFEKVYEMFSGMESIDHSEIIITVLKRIKKEYNIKSMPGCLLDK